MFFATPLTALAAPQPLTLTKVVQLIMYAINLLLGLALTIAIAMIVYNGFRMATARGDSKVFDTAKTGLWYAIIGVTVILGVGLIIATISSFAENPATIVR